MAGMYLNWLPTKLYVALPRARDKQRQLLYKLSVSGVYVKGQHAKLNCCEISFLKSVKLMPEAFLKYLLKWEISSKPRS